MLKVVSTFNIWISFEHFGFWQYCKFPVSWTNVHFMVLHLHLTLPYCRLYLLKLENIFVQIEKMHLYKLKMHLSKRNFMVDLVSRSSVHFMVFRLTLNYLLGKVSQKSGKSLVFNRTRLFFFVKKNWPPFLFVGKCINNV